MRIADLGGSARLEYLTRIVPSLSTVVADGLVFEGEAGVAMAQWACKSLRRPCVACWVKRTRALTWIFSRRTDRDAPEVVRNRCCSRMGEGAAPKKRAAAEGQLSFDIMAGVPATPSLFDNELNLTNC